MKKKIFVLFVLLGLFLFVSSEPVATIYESGKNYTIGKEGLIIVLPVSGEYTVIDRSGEWEIENEKNFVFVNPLKEKYKDLVLEIKSKINPDEKFFLKLKNDEKTKYGMLKINSISDLREKKIIPEIAGNIALKKVYENSFSKNSHIEENKQEVKKEKLPEVIKEKKKGFKTESQFSLSGGMMSFEDSSFAAQGEVIFAGKNTKGIFFQGAGKLIFNDMLKQYGFSLGAGYEPEKMGFFMFVDGISYKFGDEYDSTFHWQIRPSLRYRLSDTVHVAGFISLPIGAYQYTGVDVPGNPGFGYYNKALIHGGLDIEIYNKKLYLDTRALFGEGSIFQVDLRAGYKVLKKLLVYVNYIYSTTGDYKYLDGITSSNNISIGVQYSLRNFDNHQKNRIVFRPDYPLMVLAEKENEEDGNVSLNLVANPTEGFALLAVDFTATPSGFNGTVNYKWKYTSSNSGETTSPVSNFTYPTPGTYQAYVEGTDEKGNYAKSNEVTIIVKVNTDPDARYKIQATCSEGGYIQPMGETTAKSGNTVSISFGANDGYGVTKVTVDGAEVTSLSSPFTFKNIQSNHSIHVDFAAGAVTQYDIVSSVKAGSGTISPEGTTTVNEGASQSYAISPASGWSILRVLVDGESVGAPTTYVFENVKASHTIECEFSETPPTLYEIDATSGPNGSISPDGKTSVVKGDSITFSLTPDPGYEIDVLTVDGSQTSPNEGSDKYKFSNVTANHTINITFKRIILHVTTSVTAGEGVITESSDVYWGDNFTVTSTPVESHQVKDLVVNGGSVGQVSEITLNQIKTDQTVAVEFEIKKFTITASVRNNQWGTISPGTVEVEWGTDKSFTFSPESNKEVRRYWVNGTLQTKANSHNFNDVKADKTIEVEFQWLKYDVGVTLILDDGDTHGHINPGTGWFEYNAGESPRFDFIKETGTIIEYVKVNGQNKGTPDFYRIDEINKDYTIEVKMERKPIPVNAMWVHGTCDVNVTTNQGHSGMHAQYEVKYGDSLTFYFDVPAHLSGIKDFYLNTSEGYMDYLPDHYTFNNIIEEGEWIHVKCVNKGDPPPF